MAVPGYPGLVVEVAWTSTSPFDPAPVWVDITADVERVHPKRSSPDVTTQVDPSYCDVVVRNLNGGYDPTVAGHPNVQVGKRLRVRGIWPPPAGTSYGRFDGYIDAFVEEWDEVNTRPLMVIQCSDILALLLARAAHDPTSYRALVLGDGASVYWRMGQPAGVTAIPDEVSAGAVNAGTIGSLVLGSGAQPVRGALDADRDMATTLGLAGQKYQRAFNLNGAGVNELRGTTSWSITSWYRSAAPPGQNETQTILSFADGDGSGGASFEAWVDSSGNITCWQGSGGPSLHTATWNQTTSSGVNICDGAWHHVEVDRYAGGTGLRLKVDGVTVFDVVWASHSYGYSPTYGQRDLVWTWVGAAGYSATTGGWTGDIDEVAVWWNNTNAPGTHAAAAWASGRGRWIGQRSVDRVALLCSLLGVPAARLSLPAAGTGKALAEPDDIVNTSVGDIIRRAILSEEGQLWVDGSGQIQMRLRRTGALPVPTQTYGPGAVPTQGIPRVSQALADVVNEVSVQAPRLKDVVVQNPASITAYAARGLLPAAGSGSPAPSLSTDLTTVDDQLDMATRLAMMLGTPGPKASDVRIPGPTAAAGAYWPYLLGTEPFDVVSVKRPSVPGPVTRPAVVSEIASIDETITSDGTWDFTFGLRRSYRQPVPFSRTYAPAAQSIPNAAWTAINLVGRRAQADGMLSSLVPSVIFAGTTGPYLMSASVYLPVGSGPWGIGIRLNGATFLGVTFKPVAGLALLTCATVWQMAAGDYVELCAIQLTGAAVSIALAGNYSPELSIALLR